MHSRFTRVTVLACTIVGMSVFACAQGVPASSGLDLSASTDSPVPGQTLTITAQSYSADMASSKITWTVNGKTAQSGYGLTTLDVTAPAMGKKLSVSVTAISSGGVALSNTIAVTSGSVDMIVETNGYTPPFYKGKLPIVYQNSVTVVAMPHLSDASGAEYDPKTLIYQWKKDNQLLQDQSGYGKQSVTLVGNIVPRPYDLSVTVSTRNNSAQAVGIMSVTAGSPAISFYVNDPLYGPMFNRSVLNTVRIGTNKEVGILAVPYGFNNVATNARDLTWAWFINDTEHTDLASSRSIVLRAPEGAAGTSNIELDLSSAQNILQGAKALFQAVFSASTNNSSPAVTL